MRLLAIAGVAAAALLLAPVSPASAQGTTTALGYVLDEAGNPVSEVQVLLQYKGHQPQRYRTKTDKNGRFVHVNVWSGPYDITLRPSGSPPGRRRPRRSRRRPTRPPRRRPRRRRPPGRSPET